MVSGVLSESRFQVLVATPIWFLPGFLQPCNWIQMTCVVSLSAALLLPLSLIKDLFFGKRRASGIVPLSTHLQTRVLLVHTKYLVN